MYGPNFISEASSKRFEGGQTNNIGETPDGFAEALQKIDLLI